MASIVSKLLKENHVLVFSRNQCGYCNAAKLLLKSLNAPFLEFNMDTSTDGDSIAQYLLETTNQYTVPNIFIGGKHIGGADDLKALHKKGELVNLLKA